MDDDKTYLNDDTCDGQSAIVLETLQSLFSRMQ